MQASRRCHNIIDIEPADDRSSCAPQAPHQRSGYVRRSKKIPRSYSGKLLAMSVFWRQGLRHERVTIPMNPPEEFCTPPSFANPSPAQFCTTKNRRLHILYAVFRNAPPRSLLHCNVGLATYKVPRNLSEFRFLKAKCHARKRSACIYRDEHRVRQRHRARAQAVRNVRRTITASHDLCPKRHPNARAANTNRSSGYDRRLSPTFLNVCYDTLRKYNLHGASWRPSLSNRLEAAPHAQVALTRSVRDAYTMRILRRQIRTRSPAMVSNAVLLKALPREISYQAHKGQRPSASVVGFLKSRMTKFVVPIL